MPVAADDHMFAIFLAVPIVLGIGSTAFFFFFFFFSKNVSLKRKVWTTFVVGLGALFLVFGWLIFPANLMYIMVPGAALITLLNLRAVQFCDSCGKTVGNQNPFSKAAFCSKCGGKLVNLGTMQYCDSCGKTLMYQNPFSKAAFCSECGAKLGHY